MRIRAAVVDRVGLAVGFVALEAGVAMWSVPGALVLGGVLTIAAVFWRSA